MAPELDPLRVEICCTIDTQPQCKQVNCIIFIDCCVDRKYEIKKLYVYDATYKDSLGYTQHTDSVQITLTKSLW